MRAQNACTYESSLCVMLAVEGQNSRALWSVASGGVFLGWARSAFYK